METFYKILTKAHSGWRWIVLILLIAAVVKLYMGWKKKSEYTAKDKKLVSFAMIAFHLQWTIGMVLYFISPKVQFVEGFTKITMLRFYTLEHIVAMTIAFVLITIGSVKGKKIDDNTKRFKTQFGYFTIALLIILASIPWPFRENLAAGWF